MGRYFMELSYRGINYAGFQVQRNAVTIQSEVEKAWKIFFRGSVGLTGSSRTDAGVHALQNFFHFDWPEPIEPGVVYNLNALLPGDIAIHRIFPVKEGSHCRFHAISREYRYYLYQEKNPFLYDRAYFYPYSLDREKLTQAAAMVLEYSDFTCFSKRNTQVKTTFCRIVESRWVEEGDCLVYRVEANRFLRGMVRGLVGTMLQTARGRFSVEEYREMLAGKDGNRADFSVPGHGLFLAGVNFPADYIQDS